MMQIKTDLTEEEEKELFNYARRFDIPAKHYSHECNYSIAFRGSRENKDADIWVVLDPHGNCYNKKDNDWEWEPSPSNREESFLEDCRFTLKEAFQIVKKLN
jgi:hypothetical protein